jgi:hypothetical protein
MLSNKEVILQEEKLSNFIRNTVEKYNKLYKYFLIFFLLLSIMCIAVILISDGTLILNHKTNTESVLAIIISDIFIIYYNF